MNTPAQKASSDASLDPVILVEATPNPATRKFLPGCTISAEGPLAFNDAESAKDSPFAEALFKVDGVEAVFFGQNFISVTKTEDAAWPELARVLQEKIATALSDNLPLWRAQKGAGQEATVSQPEKAKEGTIERDIQDLLDQRIRPFVAQDGGDIIFERFEKGIVYLKMHGACQGCPSASATLKQGVENMLRHFIPEVQAVEAVS